MVQDEQRDRLQRLRNARQSGATRVEPFKGRPAGLPETPWTGPAAPRARQGHGGRFAVLLLLALIAAAVVGGVGYMFNQFHSAVGGPRRTVIFAVTSGEGVGTIAGALQRDGLVSNSLIFQLYYRVNGGANGIQVGKHVLNTSMTMDQIAQALDVAPPVPPAAPSFVCCTILAGKRVEEVAQLLAKYGVTSYKDFMYQYEHGTYNYWFLQGRPPGASLEGFLYPGFYSVTKHYDAHRLINRMLAAFGRYFTPTMRAQAARAHRSVFEIATIASIVQRESANPTIQRYIAGVYYNRLTNSDQANLELDADPTVQYALGYRHKAKTWWEPRLTQYMINQVANNSPYNTYTHQGLPPGPISNPGQSALQAAVNPAPSNYLYFAVYPDGKTHFCTTLACQTNLQGVRVH